MRPAIMFGAKGYRKVIFTSSILHLHEQTSGKTNLYLSALISPEENFGGESLVMECPYKLMAVLDTIIDAEKRQTIIEVKRHAIY